MKTRKIELAIGIILISCICVFADAWGNWNQYTLTGVGPQNWGNYLARNVVIVSVSSNWVSGHSPCGTGKSGYIDMDAASGKNIYAQFLIAQAMNKKIYIMIEQSGSQCQGAAPRIIGAQCVN